MQGKEEPPQFAETERSFRMGRSGQECLEPSLILRSTISLGSHPDSFRNALYAAVAVDPEARRLEGICLTTAPHSLPPPDGTDKTFPPVAWPPAPSPILPPQPSAVLDVETPNSTPLDAGDRWCRFSPTLPAGKSGGPHHHPGHRLTPPPSPIVGAVPRPPLCTASSGSTWRRISPWPMSPILWATAYRITWRRSSGAT